MPVMVFAPSIAREGYGHGDGDGDGHGYGDGHGHGNPLVIVSSNLGSQ